MLALQWEEGALMFALLVFAAAVAAADPGAPPVSPSYLLAHKDEYDGKRVRVTGYVVIKPHSHNIFDSKAGYEGPVGACLGLYGPASFTHTFRQRVETLSGTFRKELCRTGDICLYWCSSAGIELDR